MKRAANILHRSFCRHGAEGNDLCDIILSVFCNDIINDFLPALNTKINIEVRHGNTLRI